MAQRRYSLSKAMAVYNAVPKNSRWSWSGRSEDGSVVAVILWQDLFEDGSRTYRIRNVNPDYEWEKQPGLLELINNLKHAREHCDGIVRVVVAIARDKAAAPRSISECFPHEKLRMYVESIDEENKTAILKRVD